jgi:hypothetical protein
MCPCYDCVVVEGVEVRAQGVAIVGELSTINGVKQEGD